MKTTHKSRTLHMHMQTFWHINIYTNIELEDEINHCVMTGPLQKSVP